MKEDEKKLMQEQQPQLVIEHAVEEEKAEEATEEVQDSMKNHDKEPSLQEIIREQAIEGEAPMSKTFTLRKILGGDILSTQTIRKQIWLLLLITLFLIIYISNRYSCQQDLITIDQLNKELKDAKYRALSSASILTEKSRESHVLDILKANNDSLLKISSQPPYIISIPDGEE